MNYRVVKEFYKIDEVCYIKILPSRFMINGSSSHDLYVDHFEDIKYIRKYWKKGKLICYSLNFAFGKNKKKCNECEFFTSSNVYESPCQIRLQLCWGYKDKDYCLELPNTGIRNFLKLQKKLEENNGSISIQIRIYVAPRNNARWGEVRFEPCLKPKQ